MKLKTLMEIIPDRTEVFITKDNASTFFGTANEVPADLNDAQVEEVEPTLSTETAEPILFVKAHSALLPGTKVYAWDNPDYKYRGTLIGIHGGHFYVRRECELHACPFKHIKEV